MERIIITRNACELLRQLALGQTVRDPSREVAEGIEIEVDEEVFQELTTQAAPGESLSEVIERIATSRRVQ